MKKGGLTDAKLTEKMEVHQIDDLWLLDKLKYNRTNLKEKNMKNTLRRILVVVIIASAGYGVYASQQNVEMSDLAMENVEALAGGESGGEGSGWGYHIFPCNHSPMNECVYSLSDRPACSQPSYC